MSQSPTTPPCWHIHPMTHTTTPQIARFINFLFATNASAHTPSEPKDGQEKEIIATIGFVPAEVVRLFVLLLFRRCGLASALSLYLPGAIAFWEKHGFGVVCMLRRGRMGVWRTTRMEILAFVG
ncbi:hypothetical protein COCVIDRAFT_41785 [Bipolaris victoriae FI3]|uniref:Uncharacterized protein n=1 Tax=Bipolaris victoriae (strain FI3) TaxID=930091 RepID=W7E1U6_BIPV3|nr:hypothetical protein COCVIDRAFT_41785 [Bipolaris victoriae FI3]